ncbi:MAG TPA: PBECR2 nuclease fold domain-containing protein [Methylotenera sp.]|nr:PBECR2 nuclease fold domain-containing protein [Methylotenera sp.]
MAVNPTQLPFKEAIAFYRDKIKLPTSGWTDIWEEQHSKAFVVAGAQSDALLEDFYNALQDAKQNGGGYADFKERFGQIVDKHGWSYNGTPGWRSRITYDTNITQAYSAGRYVQMREVKHLRPYWQYEHTSIEHPRLEHKSWDGIILPADDAWFDTHMPQNGWGCKCRIHSLSSYEAEQAWMAKGNTGPDEAPKIIWEDKIVGKNGSNPRVVSTPEGIDPGFAYNPGKAYLEPHSPYPYGYEAINPKNINKSGHYVRTANFDEPLPATPMQPHWLNDKSISGEAAVINFLDFFNADLNNASVFTDKAGVNISISKALFIEGKDKASDQFKWLEAEGKAARLEYLNLLALSIADPDEIWWQWEKERSEKGRWRLQRRYLKTFEISGDTKYAISSFSWNHKTGWQGATTFVPDNKDPAEYFAKQRLGRLVYKRTK